MTSEHVTKLNYESQEVVCKSIITSFNQQCEFLVKINLRNLTTTILKYVYRRLLVVTYRHTNVESTINQNYDELTVYEQKLPRSMLANCLSLHVQKHNS